VSGLNNPAITGDVSVITSLLDLYGREAAAYVQGLPKGRRGRVIAAY